MSGPFLPSDEPQAFAVGDVVTWRSGGVVRSGTVAAVPTQYAGGEPTYTVTCTIGDATTQLVRAVELSCPPAFTSAASASVASGSPLSFTITTTGTPVPSISLASGDALPSGITLVDNGDSTATLSGTHTGAAVFHFAVNAKNTAGVVAQLFTLTVTT